MSKKNKQLLPCPLCGRSDPVAVVDRRFAFGFQSAVLCDHEIGGCGTSSGFRDTKKEARKLWNTRHYAAFGTAAQPCNKAADDFVAALTIPCNGVIEG